MRGIDRQHSCFKAEHVTTWLGLMFFIIIIHLKPEKKKLPEMISKGRLLPTICTRQRQQWYWFRLICIHCNIYTAIWTILNHGSSCSFEYVYLLRIDSNCNDQNNKELWRSKSFSNCVCLFFELCLFVYRLRWNISFDWLNKKCFGVQNIQHLDRRPSIKVITHSCFYFATYLIYNSH